MTDRIYSLIRPLLFKLEPESAHHLTFALLRCIPVSILKALYPEVVKPKELLGLSFTNSVGLAAGLDKDARYVALLAALGFGFIEIGTVTPKPQAGNVKPRLFRLTEHTALINRMGFNNQGVAALKKKLQALKYKGVLGINIGKNKDTPIEAAKEDYLYAFKELARFASYITVNLSSPNTPDLRKLQFGRYLQGLLTVLKQEQRRQQQLLKKPLPLFIKIAPDLEHSELEEIITTLIENRVEGVIATNTTLNKHAVWEAAHGREEGGLSGSPLCSVSTDMIRKIRTIDHRRQLVIMGVGGICSAADAKAKQEAGADVVQLYTGLIYQGPQLIKEVAEILV